MAADMPYGEFYDFYSVSPEYFGYTLVLPRTPKCEAGGLNAGDGIFADGGSGNIHESILQLIFQIKFVLRQTRVVYGNNKYHQETEIRVVLYAGGSWFDLRQGHRLSRQVFVVSSAFPEECWPVP
jgi:hypothetical protein